MVESGSQLFRPAPWLLETLPSGKRGADVFEKHASRRPEVGDYSWGSPCFVNPWHQRDLQLESPDGIRA